MLPDVSPAETLSPAIARLRRAFRAPALTGEGFAAEVVSGMGGAKPHLVHVSPNAARLIGLDAADCTNADFADFFVGKTPPARLTASVYSGHQFGSYVPRLGDGRALSYGVVDGPTGRWKSSSRARGKRRFRALPMAAR